MSVKRVALLIIIFMGKSKNKNQFFLTFQDIYSSRDLQIVPQTEGNKQKIVLYGAGE